MENEKRLIDANAALKKMQNWNTKERLINCVEDAPTVDAVEVVHAEWACVNESDNVWMCTGKNGCGNEILLLEGTPTGNGWHYCPNCGAKMDGGNEDANTD